MDVRMFQEVSFMDIIKKAGAIVLYFLLFCPNCDTDGIINLIRFVFETYLSFSI